MKKISYTDYILCFLAKGLGIFFRLLPVEIALFFGRCLGRFSLLVNRKRYSIAYANVKSALGDRLSPKQIKKIVKNTYANIGQGIVDVLLLPSFDDKYIEKYVEYENFHIAKDALKKGKGLIFLTAHFGTWEMCHAALPLKGFTYIGIAREQKPYLLNELLNSYRESKGCKIVMKGPSIRDALRALRSNGIVGLLVDQDAGKSGLFVDLFNRPASWNRGVMEIAYKTGATIVPGFAIRGKGAKVKFKLFSPIVLREDIDKEEAIRDGFRQYASSLEEVIREYPDQWLWQHRRWKSTPVKDLLILNDGKTGHLRQSQALCNRIKELWKAKGYSKENVRIRIVDVSFKNNFFKKLLNISCNFSHKYCQGCMSCLRIKLTKPSYDALISSYADMVVSCGSSTAGVNVLLSKELNAKSIAIMKPSLIRLSNFDLAVLPRHDNPKKAKNVVITDGALNLINDKNLEVNKNLLQTKIGHLSEKVISLLIGGDTKDFSLSVKAMDRLLDSVKEQADKNGYDILITTSRRTSKDIEDLIKQKMASYAKCKLLVIANQQNTKGVIEGMLGLSEIAIVTQESISMVSEAASSGKHVIVFSQGKDKNKRHNLFLDNLHNKGFIRLAGSENISLSISNAMNQKASLSKLDDISKLDEHIERLF